jgi:hypothetical protein
MSWPLRPDYPQSSVADNQLSESGLRLPSGRSSPALRIKNQPQRRWFTAAETGAYFALPAKTLYSLATRGRLHNAPKFDKPRRHHDKVGQHITWAEKRPEGLEAVSDFPTFCHELSENLFVVLAPSPYVLKSPNMTRGT